MMMRPHIVHLRPSIHSSPITIPTISICVNLQWSTTERGIRYDPLRWANPKERKCYFTVECCLGCLIWRFALGNVVFMHRRVVENKRQQSMARLRSHFEWYSDYFFILPLCTCHHQRRSIFELSTRLNIGLQPTTYYYCVHLLQPLVLCLGGWWSIPWDNSGAPNNICALMNGDDMLVIEWHFS